MMTKHAIEIKISGKHAFLLLLIHLAFACFLFPSLVHADNWNESFETTTTWNEVPPGWHNESQKGNTFWADPGPDDPSGWQVESVSGSKYLRMRTEAGTHDRVKLFSDKTFGAGIYSWWVYLPSEWEAGANTAVAAWLYSTEPADSSKKREIDFEIGYGTEYDRKQTLGDEWNNHNKLLCHLTVQPTDGISEYDETRHYIVAVDAGYWYKLSIKLEATSENEYRVTWLIKREDQSETEVYSFTCPYGPSNTPFYICCSLENFPDKDADGNDNLWMGEEIYPREPHHAKFRDISFSDSTLGGEAPTTTETIQVLPQNYQDTGIQLEAGQTLEIRAEGTVCDQVGCPHPRSPDGKQDRLAWDEFLAPGCPLFSLVGRIGEDGSPLCIGSSFSTQVQSGGTLYMGMNERIPPYCTGCFADNSGYWTAEVTITGP